jgi:hypothetical protein
MRMELTLPLIAAAMLLAETEGWSDRTGCTTSPTVTAQAPRDPEADPAGGDWFINRTRTIWAGWLVHDGITPWTAGGRLKTYWVRPRGSELIISGRRLDGPAEALDPWIPCCYRSGFQIVGLRFPTPGCWEVRAEAGAEELRFVTHVKADGDSHESAGQGR